MRRVFAATVVASLLASGCMLSRTVDRAFLGITIKRPAYADRKTTGLFLLPFSFAVDVATFPIQALLVVILGDGFPFNDISTLTPLTTMNDSPQFKKLNAEQRAVAAAELEQLLKSGLVTRNTALALTEDGHWYVVPVSDEARSQLIARAQAPVPAEPQAVACSQ